MAAAGGMLSLLLGRKTVGRRPLRVGRATRIRTWAASSARARRGPAIACVKSGRIPTAIVRKTALSCVAGSQYGAECGGIRIIRRARPGDRGLVVSEALKFPVTQQTTSGRQTHGYEVDLVGARADQLVLASVKSFFGSTGVVAEHVMGTAAKASFNKRYALLNNAVVRETVVEGAAERFGYPLDHVELRFYVGKFAGAKTGTHEKRIRDWCASQHVGAGPIRVVGVSEVVAQVRDEAAAKQYRDNAALVAMKVLEAAGALSWTLPSPDSTAEP